MVERLKMDDSTIARGTIELSTITGPKLTMNEEVIIFRHGDKVLATITKDSSEEDIFKGLREFISVFDGNLQKMIDDEVSSLKKEYIKTGYTTKDLPQLDVTKDYL